jgi:hypothetical protein
MSGVQSRTANPPRTRACIKHSRRLIRDLEQLVTELRNHIHDLRNNVPPEETQTELHRQIVETARSSLCPVVDHIADMREVVKREASFESSGGESADEDGDTQ